MEIILLLRQYDWTIFEGVISPFDLKHFIKKTMEERKEMSFDFVSCIQRKSHKK